MSVRRRLIGTIFFCIMAVSSYANYILVPMDEGQTDHLKSYGVTYWVLQHDIEAWWLLNYRGGSFAFPYNELIEKECKTRGIRYEITTDVQFNGILREIAQPEINMDALKLDKAPKIAVYTPDFNARGERIQPWDDAVTLVLTYAEIPYDVVYDREVMDDKLAQYDWLHLHHEDFTGQYGKFYARYKNQKWYMESKRRMESLAGDLGFGKVSDLKLAVAEKIREYVIGGGFLFAMCSATDTYDIALAAANTDICDWMFDGDPQDPDAQQKLDFTNTFAFENFQLVTNPMVYEYSNIDNIHRRVNPENDYFTLFDFSAKWDPIPTMLTQNHTRTVKGFMGQTTSFTNATVKSSVLILGENKAANEVRYLHGEIGKGQFSFFGGHDPEDYAHYVNDPETDLSLHPNSPGYRLILNNILFPAARKQKRKT